MKIQDRTIIGLFNAMLFLPERERLSLMPLMPTREPQPVDIATLVPYELGGVRTRMEGISPSSMLPILVELVDGVPLVRNGTNRVLAARSAGLTCVPARIRAASKSDLPKLRAIISLRERQGRVGFENMPVYENDQERDAMTEAEEREIERTRSGE